MASVSLTALRARVREAVDIVGSSFVTDSSTSLDALINAAAHELYKLLVTTHEDYFATKSHSVTLVAGTSEYDLPADFFKVRGVDILDGSTYRELGVFQFRERNRQATGNLALKYQVRGSKLIFAPAPVTAGTARLLYIGQFTAYSAAGDSVEWWDWEEFIIQRAAAKVAVKEETDPSPYMAEAERIKADILKEADARHTEEPASVGDADDPVTAEDAWLLS